MERSSQPPKTEGCSTEGQEPIDLWFYRAERPSEKRTQEQARAASGTRIPLKQCSLESLNTGGDEVTVAEPNTVRADKGKVQAGRSGSESVARVEGEARNRGGPAGPCRTNCEGQAGRKAQRQEAPSGQPGVGSAHSTQSQGASPEAGEGADRLTQSAQATSAVRTDGVRLANLPADHSREGISAQTLPVRRLVSVSQSGGSASVLLAVTPGCSQWRGRSDFRGV